MSMKRIVFFSFFLPYSFHRVAVLLLYSYVLLETFYSNIQTLLYNI